MRTLPDNLNTTNSYYCFEVRLTNGNILYLTSTDRVIRNNDHIYYPYSGLNVVEALFNDSAKDQILVEGIYEDKGISKNLDIAGAPVKIYIVFDNYFHHLVTYTCTEHAKYNLNFIIKLEPESIKYNQTITKKYSKTCRANFGDNKCCVDKNKHSLTAQIIEIIGCSIKLDQCASQSNYFTGGKAYIEDLDFKANILMHNGNNITLDKAIPCKIEDGRNILLEPTCDKNFITCCNKFNNAVNFRGEPSIPDHNFLKSF